MPDAFGPQEEAISWHIYLSERLEFPFSACCVMSRATSPLKIGDKVKVLEMASEEESEHEILVLIRWKSRRLAVPLGQLEGSEVDEEVRQAIEDWHYWMSHNAKW